MSSKAAPKYASERNWAARACSSRHTACCSLKLRSSTATCATERWAASSESSALWRALTRDSYCAWRASDVSEAARACRTRSAWIACAPARAAFPSSAIVSTGRSCPRADGSWVCHSLRGASSSSTRDAQSEIPTVSSAPRLCSSRVRSAAQSTSGSYTKASRSVRRVSLDARSTRSTASQEEVNAPSVPPSPRAACIVGVIRNGTVSGT